MHPDFSCLLELFAGFQVECVIVGGTRLYFMACCDEPGLGLSVYLYGDDMSIVLLRLSYWIAAIADFAIAVLVLMPARMGTVELAYPMGFASAIAFSWGVMLLIADRKPLERRWVLVPTAMVVALLTLVRATFVLKGTVPASASVLTFGIALTVLILYSYFRAGRSVKSDDG